MNFSDDEITLNWKLEMRDHCILVHIHLQRNISHNEQEGVRNIMGHSWNAREPYHYYQDLVYFGQYVFTD